MVAVALVLLVQEHGNLWLTLPAAVIIGREIVVSALREWMAEIGARAQVQAIAPGRLEEEVRELLAAGRHVRRPTDEREQGGELRALKIRRGGHTSFAIVDDSCDLVGCEPMGDVQ